MTRTLVVWALVSWLLIGCNRAEPPSAGTGGLGGSTATGGSGGRGGTGGSGGSTTAGSGGTTGSGGSAGTGGSAGSGTGGGTADSAAAGADGSADGPASFRDTSSGDLSAAPDGAGMEAGRPGILGEGADYPGRPEVRLCNKEWTHEQCCEFLCRCLSEICSDAPKAQKGIPTCKNWCPKLSNMAMRCHVYHCFESVSMGGKKDHDSHCGHAADQVPGGMCRPFVYQ